MPVKVKKITLWRKELENRAGTLSETLEPLAKAGADLQIVMGYCYPGERTRDRKSTRLNSSHSGESRMPSSA